MKRNKFPENLAAWTLTAAIAAAAATAALAPPLADAAVMVERVGQVEPTPDLQAFDAGLRPTASLRDRLPVDTSRTFP